MRHKQIFTLIMDTLQTSEEVKSDSECEIEEITQDEHEQEEIDTYYVSLEENDQLLLKYKWLSNYFQILDIPLSALPEQVQSNPAAAVNDDIYPKMKKALEMTQNWSKTIWTKRTEEFNQLFKFLKETISFLLKLSIPFPTWTMVFNYLDQQEHQYVHRLSLNEAELVKNKLNHYYNIVKRKPSTIVKKDLLKTGLLDGMESQTTKQISVIPMDIGSMSATHITNLKDADVQSKTGLGPLDWILSQNTSMEDQEITGSTLASIYKPEGENYVKHSLMGEINWTKCLKLKLTLTNQNKTLLDCAMPITKDGTEAQWISTQIEKLQSTLLANPQLVKSQTYPGRNQLTSDSKSRRGYYKPYQRLRRQY